MSSGLNLPDGKHPKTLSELPSRLFSEGGFNIDNHTIIYHQSDLIYAKRASLVMQNETVLIFSQLL
jgi:hypothetical protein